MVLVNPLCCFLLSVNFPLMAASNLKSQLLLFLFVTLVFSNYVVAADSATNPEANDFHSAEVTESSLKIELHQLNSKISTLETRIDERIQELKHKDENLEHLENLIQEKSAGVNSLKNEVKLLQERGSLDAKYKLVEATVRAGELEKQVDSLKKDIETQAKRKAALESRANLAEKKIQDLNHKFENLQRINDEQKNRIRKTEHALQVAEEEMVKAKLEVVDFSKEVKEVHDSWIPPWLAVHLDNAQMFTVTLWNEQGKPTLDATIQKVLEKKVQFENWLEPRIETLITQWVPTVKEWWSAFVTNIGPNVQLLAGKTADIYHASQNVLGPHIAKVQKTIEPYFKEAEKYSRPYIDHVSTTMKPHVDKAHILLKPYSKKVLRGYRKFTKAVTVYHRQVRAVIQDFLRSHEITKQIATKEIVWYMASALMALPVIIIFNSISTVFSKKPKKRTRHSHSSHTRRKAKRVTSDRRHTS